MHATALIAEDEALLAQALRSELAAAWPELEVVAVVGDGAAAVREALQRLPQILFLDIRMPGLDGLGAAGELADAWPVDRAPMPQLVFVTAYDEYAARAFDAQAIDYVLKPVQPARLARTVQRLQEALRRHETQAGRAPAEALTETLERWHQLLAAAGGPRPASAQGSGAMPLLRHVAASEAGSSGQTVRMLPIGDVLYFEAADKYIRVLTARHEYLIRTPLKQLLAQLDPERFWQIHRALVVNRDAIDVVHRDEAGKLQIGLHGRTEKLPVSRLYTHLFRAM